MWPFRRKAFSPAQQKSASYLLALGGANAKLTNAAFKLLAQEGYRDNAIVNACINRIANAVASVEPQIYQKKKNKLAKFDTHPLLELIESPNPAQSGKEFIRYLVSYYLTGGNAYIFGNGINPATRSSKPPTELQLFNPGNVVVEPGAGMFPASYVYKPDPSKTFPYPVDPLSGRSAVFHLKTFNPLDPWYGLPPMMAAALGIDIHTGGQRWNMGLLNNGARPSGALTVKGADGSPQTLSDDQYIRLKQMMDEQFSGEKNSGRPMLLEGGLDWKEMSINPKDMEFLEGKNSAASDIGLVFGVPAQLLGIKDASTFANYEQANLSFWTDTVLPLAGLIFEGFNRWLAPLYGDDIYIWYDEDQIPALEPRRKEKFDRLNSAEFMTIDEKRVAMGEADLPNDIGKVIVIAGRGVLLNAVTGEIVSLAPATPTTEDGVDTPEPDVNPDNPAPPPKKPAKDPAKHAAWLMANGYSKERAERLTKLAYE